MAKWFAAIDMDGTILKERTVDVLVKHYNIEEKLREIDTKYRNLKEYKKSEKIATFLKGFKSVEMLDVFRKIPLNDGIKEIIDFLLNRDYLVAIVTNSYTFLANDLAKRIGINNIFGNELEIKNGFVTGKILMPLNWADKDCQCHSICKITIVKEFAERNKIPQSRILAIGDSGNDYCMLKYAQIAVAYRTTANLLNSIPNVIKANNFHDVLPLLQKKMD